jgi:hypothetical protein
MEGNGRDLGETYRFTTCNQIEQSWGTHLLRKGGVTYVTQNQVTLFCERLLIREIKFVLLRHLFLWRLPLHYLCMGSSAGCVGEIQCRKAWVKAATKWAWRPIGGAELRLGMELQLWKGRFWTTADEAVWWGWWMGAKKEFEGEAFRES